VEAERRIMTVSPLGNFSPVLRPQISRCRGGAGPDEPSGSTAQSVRADQNRRSTIIQPPQVFDFVLGADIYLLPFNSNCFREGGHPMVGLCRSIKTLVVDVVRFQYSTNNSEGIVICFPRTDAFAAFPAAPPATTSP
jgi:hypothetical protein